MYSVYIHKILTDLICFVSKTYTVKPTHFYKVFVIVIRDLPQCTGVVIK